MELLKFLWFEKSASLFNVKGFLWILRLKRKFEVAICKYFSKTHYGNRSFLFLVNKKAKLSIVATVCFPFLALVYGVLENFENCYYFFYVPH